MKKTFAAGAVGYGLLEVMWRGYTHPSMLLTGGVALCIMKKISAAGGSILRAAARCTAVVTALELCVGVAVNKVLKLGVWDYSGRWGNLWGQICPMYCGLWYLLSLAVVTFYRFIFSKKGDIM